MKFSRPVIFFDLETTGTDIIRDRIVEISILKYFPDSGATECRTWRVNPGRPIPPEATNVHHITDEDVKNEPQFKDIANELARIFQDCDIAGFNSNKFDLPLLYEEMSRAGVVLDYRKVNLIDVQTIFHKKEPRNLSAAYRFYCQKPLEGAHSAQADIMATFEVFMAQLEKYKDLPSTVEELSEYTSYKYADLMGRFVRDENNKIRVNFGKYKGKLLTDVLRTDPSYYTWMINGDFARDTKRVLDEVKNMMKP